MMKRLDRLSRDNFVTSIILLQSSSAAIANQKFVGASLRKNKYIIVMSTKLNTFIR